MQRNYILWLIANQTWRNSYSKWYRWREINALPTYWNVCQMSRARLALGAPLLERAGRQSRWHHLSDFCFARSSSTYRTFSKDTLFYVLILFLVFLFVRIHSHFVSSSGIVYLSRLISPSLLFIYFVNLHCFIDCVLNYVDF